MKYLQMLSSSLLVIYCCEVVQIKIKQFYNRSEVSCFVGDHVVASELKDPICHSDECQIGSFSSEATMSFLNKI